MSDSAMPVRRALASRWPALLGLIAALLLAVPTAGVVPSAAATVDDAVTVAVGAALHHEYPSGDQPQGQQPPQNANSFGDQPQGQQPPQNANSFGDQPFVTRPTAPTAVALSSRGGSRLIQPVPVAALPVAGAGQRTDRGWRAGVVAETPAGVSGRTERGRGPPAQPR